MEQQKSMHLIGLPPQNRSSSHLNDFIIFVIEYQAWILLFRGIIFQVVASLWSRRNIRAGGRLVLVLGSLKGGGVTRKQGNVFFHVSKPQQGYYKAQRSMRK